MSLDRDAAALYSALSRLVRSYQFRDRERICCHGISVTQCYALEWLREEGPMRLAALADRLMLDTSTTSRVVDSLVRKHLATRVEDPEDRRAVRLALTEPGKQLYERIRAELIEEERAVLTDLTAEERRGAIKLLERLSLMAEERNAVCASTPDEDVTAKSC